MSEGKGGREKKEVEKKKKKEEEKTKKKGENKKKKNRNKSHLVIYEWRKGREKKKEVEKKKKKKKEEEKTKKKEEKKKTKKGWTCVFHRGGLECHTTLHTERLHRHHLNEDVTTTLVQTAGEEFRHTRTFHYQRERKHLENVLALTTEAAGVWTKLQTRKRTQTAHIRHFITERNDENQICGGICHNSFSRFNKIPKLT